MKYTNESAAGRARAEALGRGNPQGQPTEAPTTRGAQKVDPSVTLGPREGEIRGAVPMSVTIGKPQAYTAKKGSP
jgi:hypothetical protein